MDLQQPKSLRHVLNISTETDASNASLFPCSFQIYVHRVMIHLKMFLIQLVAMVIYLSLEEVVLTTDTSHLRK